MNKKNILKKSLILVIIILFVGASVVPSISGNLIKLEDGLVNKKTKLSSKLDDSNWQWANKAGGIDNDSESGLAADDSVDIIASVIAPDTHNIEYTGKIKIVNTDNPGDFCEIDVYLKTSTSRNKAINTPFLNFLQNHPHLFPILRYLLLRLY